MGRRRAEGASCLCTGSSYKAQGDRMWGDRAWGCRDGPGGRHGTVMGPLGSPPLMQGMVLFHLVLSPQQPYRCVQMENTHGRSENMHLQQKRHTPSAIKGGTAHANACASSTGARTLICTAADGASEKHLKRQLTRERSRSLVLDRIRILALRVPSPPFHPGGPPRKM